MVLIRTTVTLPNGDRIRLVGGRPSVRGLIQLLINRGYLVEVRLFPTNILLSVPVVGRPFLLFFRNAFLTVCKPAVSLAFSASISKLEESLESSVLWFHVPSNSDAVNSEFPELGRRGW